MSECKDFDDKSEAITTDESKVTKAVKDVAGKATENPKIYCLNTRAAGEEFGFGKICVFNIPKFLILFRREYVRLVRELEKDGRS